MPISVTCSSCGQKLKAKDTLAGRTLPCPKCSAKIAIPALAEDDVAALLLADEPAPSKTEPDLPKPRPKSVAPRVNPPIDPPRASAPAAKAAVNPITMNEPPVWLRHLHWALIIALIPLGLALLGQASEVDSFDSKLDRTLAKSAPDVAVRVDSIINNLNAGKGSIDDLFKAIPDRRLDGALLARDSWTHWVFAGISAVAFLVFLVLLASYQSDGALRVVWIAVFTATIGIFFLLLVQKLAAWSAMFTPRGFGILTIFLVIAKIIGFSYAAALDPENGFLLSFFGFTVGVGFCEEVCKSIPVFLRIRQNPDLGWRDAFLSGLASGAGFGISEGIMYSSNYYNGIAGVDLYVIRFVSCVALHALWTGSVAITIQQNQHLFYDKEAWYEFIPPLVRVVGVPMILHGLYDTFLKKDMNGFALGAAVLSFVFLAYQISQLHSVDDERERKAMLREYKKRRKSMA